MDNSDVKALATLSLRDEVHIQNDKMNSEKVVFWKRQDEEGQKWLRISNQARAAVTEDGAVLWTEAFVAEYEKVRRSIWQKLRKSEIAGAIGGPNNDEYQPTGPKSSASLIWSQDVSVDVDKEIADRVTAAKAKIIKLGPSLAVVQGAVPVKLSLILGASYGPRFETFIDERETQIMLQEGMDYILGQVYDFPEDGEHVSAPLLRNLKQFRKEKARWAAIGDDRSIRSIEPGKPQDAWMAVVPKENPIAQEQKNAVMVRREPGGIILMRALPVAYTREWAGLMGVHEMEHLENAHTGKEPVKPSREEYIDGEVRAFTVEMGAADIISKGRYNLGIDAMIEKFGWKTYKDVLALTGSELMIMFPNNLDPYISSQRPRSQAEEGMRFAFYLVSTSFRMAEREAEKMGDPELAVRLKREIINQVYAKHLSKDISEEK